MRSNPVPPLALFAAAYIGATLALTQESLLLAGCALGLTQVAAALLLWRRPALVRERLRAAAPPRLPAPGEGTGRGQEWRRTAALVEHGREETPRPLCEPAGSGLPPADLGADAGALVFWAVTDPNAGAAVEIFRSRSVAEAALGDVAAREPAATAGLSVVRIDFAALAGMSADGGSYRRAALSRAGGAGGQGGEPVMTQPPDWLYRRGA
jgi:hypothetical protein